MRARKLNHIAVVYAKRGSVFSVHGKQGLGQRAVELLDAARHGAGMPVLEQTARAEPEREFRGRLLRRRLIRAEDHRRLVVGALVPAHAASKTLIAIHLDTDLVIAVGLLTIGKTPLGGQPLPIDLRTGQVRPWCARYSS